MPEEQTSWRTNPFLHFKEFEIYNPLCDAVIKKGEPGFGWLRKYRRREFFRDRFPPDAKADLVEKGWVVPSGSDMSTRYFLKYASIETHTVCNQACRFCPVSISPREPHFMPTALFDRIVGELSGYRDTLQGVFLNNYNEPFCDKRIIEQVRSIKDARLNPAILTNGTELTAERVDALVDIGGVGYLAVNMASLQRDAYAAYHGRDNCDRVLRHLEYAKNRRAADRMAIVVLGDGGDRHRQDYEAIRKRFGDSRFEIRLFAFVDRAGFLAEGTKPEGPHENLCGCEEFGSRPLQHIHVNSFGKCLLCCQDYQEKYIVGDLNRETIEDVLTGPKLSALRMQIYGLEQAPPDFICRKCVFALPC